MGTVPATAGITGWLGHAGNGFATALGKEYRDFALGVLPTTESTRDGRIRLAHRADGLENFFAVLTNILVNRHKNLFSPQRSPWDTKESKQKIT
jgi:hypothetical protein